MSNLTETNQKSASKQPWKSNVKSFLKRLRLNLLGDTPPQLLPITCWNSFYWIKYTFKTDWQHYQKKERSLSVRRLLQSLNLNLHNPIFIIGSPRSGTTFLGECISQIPEVSYHFEPVITKAAVRYVYTGLWSTEKARWLYKTAYRWLMRIHLDGDLRFAEKTPQTSFIIPFLAQIFPKAKFVHILRDGRDVAISLAEKPWHRLDKKGSSIRDPDGYLCGPWARFWVEPYRVEEFETTNDLHRCIWIWRRHVEEVLRAKPGLPSQAYHELRYEDLVRNPVQESVKILDFLNISNADARQTFQDAVTSRVKSNSVGRWKTTLTEEQLEQLNRESGNLMHELGYID